MDGDGVEDRDDDVDEDVDEEVDDGDGKLGDGDRTWESV